MKRWWMIIALAALHVGCTGPQEKPEPEDETVIGKPPPPSDDPFGFVSMPDEAQPVDTKGVIGSEAPTDLYTEKVETNTTPELVEPEAATPEKNEPAAPEKAAVEPTLPAETSTKTEPGSARCFSCVKICPIVNGQNRCPEREDVICGWGVHPERVKASRLAQAECDGALDMAREMPRFSSIEGQCPIATCESSP